MATTRRRRRDLFGGEYEERVRARRCDPPAPADDRPPPPKRPKHGPYAVSVWVTNRGAVAARPRWYKRERKWAGRWEVRLTSAGACWVVTYLAAFPEPQALLSVTVGGRKLMEQAREVLDQDEITAAAMQGVVRAVMNWLPLWSRPSTFFRSHIYKRVQVDVFPWLRWLGRMISLSALDRDDGTPWEPAARGYDPDDDALDAATDRLWLVEQGRRWDAGRVR